MAKNKINIPYKVIVDSMLVPEGFSKNNDKLAQLPAAGSSLLEDPTFKVAKKKKKKKKS